MSEDPPWGPPCIVYIALVSRSHMRVSPLSQQRSFRITFQDYRHMAKAIDRMHVRGLTEEMDEDQDHIHDLASTHSSATADEIYGIDASMLRSLSARTMNSLRSVGDRWHQFLQFNNRQQWTRTRTLLLHLLLTHLSRSDREGWMWRRRYNFTWKGYLDQVPTSIVRSRGKLYTRYGEVTVH